MADPITISLSLDSIAMSHPVFEEDQVLTHEQLNGVTRYLDDQSRLTRVELLGVGVVGGLRPSVKANVVTVTRGLGVTTDGDLLFVEDDLTFDRFKPYDESAPKYAPFYNGAAMRPMFELIAKGVTDPGALPLAQIPIGPLKQLAVVLLMETYEVDHDLCTGTDCDNIGRDCVSTRRVLVMSKADAAALGTMPATLSATARAIVEISADRPAITGSPATVSAVTSLYLNTCKSINTALVAALPSLHAAVPSVTTDAFGSDPAPGWIASLTAIGNSFTSTRAGVQYYYSFLKDLVETWSALRDALLDCDSSLMPDVVSFPKHLVLGVIGAPSSTRTPFLPSPLTTSRGDALERATLLARKLHALISTFALPATSPAPEIIITPSRSELYALEERAIPYYYAPNDQNSVWNTWSPRLSRRGTMTGIYGYRAKDFGASAAAQAPLLRQIGSHDFFRIEGHLGQDVEAATAAIEARIAAHNLPFAVRSVLLHSDATRIKVKPKIRYGDLHRLHKIVRAEIDSELARAETFSIAFHSRVKSAASNGEIPNDSAKLTKADTLASTIGTSTAKARSSLSKKTYSESRADRSWIQQHDETIKAASSFKQEFGDVSRTDVVTAFDTAATSNFRNWADWLDVLIDAKDRVADERLLFARFLKDHPGIDHAGGVPRGGTFVLVYDDSGKVVLDFMLPYRVVEDAETEPEEPTFTYTPPATVKDGFIIQKPISMQFDALKIGIRDEWTKEVDLQKSYLSFFQKNIDVLQSAKTITSDVTPDGGRKSDRIKDALARYHAENVVTANDRVDRLRNLIQDPETTADAREKLQKELEGAEKEVATRVSEATQYVAQSNLDMAKGGGGDATLKIISEGIERVSNADVRKSMSQGLKTTLDTAPQSPNKAAISNMLKSNNFRL